MPPLYWLLVADGAVMGQDHQSKQYGDFALAVALCTASFVSSVVRDAPDRKTVSLHNFVPCSAEVESMSRSRFLLNKSGQKCFLHLQRT